MSIYTGTVTQGLWQDPTSTSFGSLLANGLSPSISQTSAPEPSIPLADIAPLPNSPVNQANLQALQSTVYGPQGTPTQASPYASIDLGNGSILSFDLSTLDAIATPAIPPPNILYDDAGESMFTASDCSVMMEVSQNPVFNGSSITSRVAKQLLELSTLSISSHRSKSPARAFGYINPRGFTRGSRTIAGTMILSKTTAEVMYRFLQSGLMADLSKDTIYNKIDQLPPFDFTLLFSNEAGYVSSQRLLGVEFVTDGNVISIQDIIMEQQITWVAADFTPLTPVNFNTFFGVNTTASNATAIQPTVGSVIARQQSNTMANSSSSINASGAGSGIMTQGPTL